MWTGKDSCLMWVKFRHGMVTLWEGSLHLQETGCSTWLTRRWLQAYLLSAEKKTRRFPSDWWVPLGDTITRTDIYPVICKRDGLLVATSVFKYLFNICHILATAKMVISVIPWISHKCIVLVFFMIQIFGCESKYLAHTHTHPIPLQI